MLESLSNFLYSTKLILNPCAASLYNNTKKFVRDAHKVDIVLPKSFLVVKIKVHFASKTTSAFCSHALNRGGREMRE